jgi:hypothetical protein
MEISIATPLAAFAAGVITSLHCAGMCGPLACALFARCKHGTTLTYQVSRIATYTITGGVLGKVGQSGAHLFSTQPMRLVPWMFVLLFAALALGLDRRLPLPSFSRRITGAALKSRSSWFAPFWLGIFTPLIPCGPLYFMFGMAVITGSWLTGALLLLFFGLGTLPLYLLAQLQWTWLQSRFSTASLQWMRQGLAGASAGLLVWRVVMNGGLGLAQTLCH